MRIDPLFHQVGELIINWCVMDSQLVKMVAILHDTEYGKGIQPLLPREFGRRLKFLRKCFANMPELSLYARDVARMLTTAKEMARVRDTLVHGAISSYDETDKRYSFVKLDIDKPDDIHVATTVRITIDHIQTHALVSQDLMAFAIKVTYHLVQVFDL